MGIGSQKVKGGKKTMKDFILSTLTKNRVEGCYVSKKGGPPKPQSVAVNERGHLVNPATLQPLSTKNIRPLPSKPLSSGPPASTKHLSEASNKLN